MPQAKGQVKFIKENQTKYGSMFGVALTSGKDYYGFGKVKPAFSEGDYVAFMYETNDRGFLDAVPETVKVKKGELPAKKAYQGGGSGSSRDKYWEDKEARDIETQKRITYQSAKNNAVSIVELALANGALSLGAKKSEAFDNLLAVINKVTLDTYQEYTEAPSIEFEDVEEEEDAGPSGEPEEVEEDEDDWTDD